ncbi:hypothetical protein D0T12_28840 [Actinomadura spongiicola]|uniref:Uncharacterized protein n=1 Tax=Actinomadura spongiicola TaxID=2303421 RepID=A0A372GAX9_9ACTN|nr:hypothetical protein [Actinomadura spongiicola]RFS82243.1 hypothetical protein D0T12_28840 [Actinomadura spongiicola]
MSGAKTISVDAGAWREAQRAARRLAEVRRDMPKLLDDVRRQTRADIDRAVSAVTTRQARTDQRLRELSEHTRDLERRTSARLREQAGRLKAVRAETKRLSREIDQERQERERQFADLDARVTDITERRDQATRRARVLFDDAGTLAAAIGELPHERFAPGRLRRLEQRLAQTAVTLNEQEPAFSLGLVQNLYFDLSDLRVDVEEAALEWERARFEALDALHAADAVTVSNIVVPMRAMDGTVLDDIDLDVNFWTDGDAARLLDRIREQAGVVADPDCPLTLDELRAIVQRDAPAYEQELTDLLERAWTRTLASQQRANTAEIAIAALEQQGYELADEAWEGEDFRGAHYSKLVSLTGRSELVVEIAPDGDAGMAIRVLSYDSDAAEDRRRQRTESMLGSLRSAGIPAGAPEDRGTEPTPEEGDLEAIRRRRRRVG